MFSSRQKIVTPKIVQHGSKDHKWWLLLLLVLVAVWSWFVFDFGRQRAGLDSQGYQTEIDTLEEEIRQKNKRIDELRLESAAHQRAAQIDKNAAVLAQQGLKELQQERAELKREVDFLNGLLSDKSKKAVLSLKHLQVSKMAGSNSYNLSFTLLHLSKVGGKAKGAVTLLVSGLQDDKKMHLKLENVTADKQKTLKMGFKNFQKFDVTLTLPDGFEPVDVTVSANVESKDIENFEQTLPWQVTENN